MQAFLAIFPVAITTLFIFIFNRKLTIPLSLVILVIPISASIIATYSSTDELLYKVITLTSCFVAVAGYLLFCYYYKDLDFNKRIYSLALDKNKIKKNGRIIGKCLPYYRGQLKYNNSTIVQSNLSLRGGTVMTGASGSGKTFTIVNFIKQDVAMGKSVVFLDFKGDRSTAQDIKDSVGEACKVYELSWEGCSFSYDPLKSLDDAGKVEAILNMRKWSLDGKDDHYKTGVQLFLQKTISEFNYKGGNYIKEFYNFLRRYNVSRELYDAYNSTMKLLELTITSNVGQSLFCSDNEKFTFETDEQFVLIVQFTSAVKTLGTSITSLMLRDIMEIGVKRSYDPDLCLYIDEFGSCESTIVVKDILEKGRSAHIETLISMQDINQLIINTNEPFLDSVLGTINTCIVFAGCTKNSASKMAGVVINEIDNLLMSLKKPVNGKPPTAMFIGKYPVFGKSGTEIYRFTPSSKQINLANIPRTNKTNSATSCEDEELEVTKHPQELAVENTADVYNQQEEQYSTNTGFELSDIDKLI